MVRVEPREYKDVGGSEGGKEGTRGSRAILSENKEREERWNRSTSTVWSIIHVSYCWWLGDFSICHPSFLIWPLSWRCLRHPRNPPCHPSVCHSLSFLSFVSFTCHVSSPEWILLLYFFFFKSKDIKLKYMFLKVDSKTCFPWENNGHSCSKEFSM